MREARAELRALIEAGIITAIQATRIMARLEDAR